MQIAYTQNWTHIKEKIAKQINKVSQRILSLKGKTQIVNTLILSKTSFLRNIFPIDLQTTLSIQKQIFKYFWKNKQEQIPRKTIFLPKNPGGLNLLEPQAHKMVMRIKHILQLKQKNNTPTWENIATYWLAVDLYKISKSYQFLMSNNRVKTINNNKPFYDKNIIYYIKTENTEIQKIQNPTTKYIYKEILQNGSKQYQVAGEKLWKKLIPNLDFQKIWKNPYISYAEPFCADLHFKILHYSIKTNEYMHKCTRDVKPNCDYYRQIENNIHLFITCPRIRQIWTGYQPILTKLTNIQNKPEEHILTLSTANQNESTTKLLLTITQIILYEIWKTRNNYKYDKTQIPQDIIRNKINTRIWNIIQIHYKYHKTNGTINIFKELFCINNALAKI